MEVINLTMRTKVNHTSKKSNNTNIHAKSNQRILLSSIHWLTHLLQLNFTDLLGRGWFSSADSLCLDLTEGGFCLGTVVPNWGEIPYLQSEIKIWPLNGSGVKWWHDHSFAVEHTDYGVIVKCDIRAAFGLGKNNLEINLMLFVIVGHP